MPPGPYHLTVDEFESPWVCLAAWILADSGDPEDIQTVNKLQDQLSVEAPSNRPFVRPDYDEMSYPATRNAVLELARYGGDFGNVFGRREAVDPIQHLLASAVGSGGLTREEAVYLSFEPTGPLGEYKIEFGDVPVGAFWSISLSIRDGYFQANSRNVNSVNSLTAVRNDDGSTTAHFGSGDENKPNYFRLWSGGIFWCGSPGLGCRFWRDADRFRSWGRHRSLLRRCRVVGAYIGDTLSSVGCDTNYWWGRVYGSSR